MSPTFELTTFLHAIRRRWRLLSGVRAATAAIVGVSIVLAALALLFWTARPSADVLLVAALAALAAIAAWVVRALRPALDAPDDGRLARFVEEHHPELNDALVTAVQVKERDTGFARALVAEAAAQSRAIEPDEIVPRADVRQAMGRGLAACALLLVTGGASLEPLHRAIDAARVRLFPARIAIAVEPGDARVLAGGSLTLRATVTGLPDGFDPAPVVMLLDEANGARREPMVRDGETFRLVLPSLQSSFAYDVSAAGTRSREYRVTVLHRPAVSGIDVSYEYPAFTGMPARVEEDSGDIYAPAGTRVTVHVRSSKPLRSGALRLGRNTLRLGGTGDERRRATSFVVERDGSYRVELTDTDGLESEPSSEYFVRVTDDRPPEVRILRPEGDRAVTALEEVQIAAAAEDDYRLSSLELVFAVGAQPERVVSLSRSAAPSLAGGHLLYLEELDVQPGDVVRAYARAKEAKQRGARVAVSEMLLLTVMPFDQEFSLAQSQAGGGGGGDRELESLIQGQRNLVNATWNLLRRQAAGQSAADVETLATAQGELKSRAEALASRVRARGPDGETSNPLARAAAAMGRAEESLRRRRLQEAMPHEMQALTELTRAEAENRQRQIQQQRSSGGGGGGGRSNVDLSALFDRELLRQQQTNYENRESGSSSRDERRESDAQQRIKELARRQDELARQQRELASRRMNEEERRRQLERLTREQEELRREAEALARDMSGQGASAGEREQAERLRDAAQEMRGASGDMRRNDPESASQRGSRAAEQLRDAERQQASSQAASGARSAGELQMEAQQLADEQRRLESEQRRSRDGSSSGEPGEAAERNAAERRQMAREQRQLAERAERLERDARSLAAGGGDERQRQAASEAARDMRRDRVAERMRENADALGRQAQAQGTERERGSGEQDGRRDPKGQGDVSAALDRVAERLGASADAETRKLANELEKSRAARDRLREMERRLERATREGDEAAAQELARELSRGGEMLRDLQRGAPENGAAGTTPEEHEYSRSAPGLESFKQDFARWEQLKRDIELAIERRNLAIAERLRGAKEKDPLAAGSVPALPPAYRDKVARYFELLAREGRRP